MNKTLDMLVKMDKELNMCIANQEADLAAVNKKLDVLQEEMVKKIRNDLLEYLEYYKKIEIKESRFILDIELNPLGLRNEVGNRYYIAIFFDDMRVMLSQVSCKPNCKSVYTSYGIWSTKCIKWGNRDFVGNSLNIIYENWSGIKADFEKKFTEQYIKEKTAKCKDLNKQREKVVGILNEAAKLI